MDYETAKDFEINKAVAEALGYESPSVKSQNHAAILIHGKGTPHRPIMDNYNPCNNPSDAWPIIVENDIEVKPNKKGFDYAQAFVLVQNGRCHAIFSHHCHGVLRAAMIVFLKMKGAE